MIKHIVLFKLLVWLVAITLISTGCGSSKSIVNPEKNKVGKNNKTALIERAKTYLGTPYRLGGDDRSGMDCSGLIYRSFQEINQRVGRTTKDLISLGRRVKLKFIKPGDLVFFKTFKSKAKATHVGLITKISKNTIRFIHSGSSTGVTISKLQDQYWQKRFVFARRPQ